MVSADYDYDFLFFSSLFLPAEKFVTELKGFEHSHDYPLGLLKS